MILCPEAQYALQYRFRNRRGLAFWYNTALITFAAIAIAITWTVMNSGFSSSEVVKEVVEDAVTHSANGLQVVGKMTGATEIEADQVTVTGTPVTSTTSGRVNMSIENAKISYTIIKDGSHTITYDNIYAGMISDESFNSLGDALVAAKERGLITVNPLEDNEKPDRTTAFMYWIIDQNFDKYVENDEIANIVIVYAEKDRPSTGEYILIRVYEERGVMLYLERTVPNISSSILDFGGKIRN